uniref:Poly [ADP-ribose] polymerase n=1 Tax=Naja naja TaxID=35670 RepID=A0A8C6Y7C4_NAJNA
MAEGEASYRFPLVVEGNWGCSLSKTLKNKLLCYFQSPKRSGGGECKILVDPVILFYISVRESVLSIKSHELSLPGMKTLKLTVLQRDCHQISKIALHVKKYQQELSQDPSSSLVVLENVPETTIECMLILLVETVSGLSEEDKDFNVEMMPECNAAVITFIKPIETNKFIRAFNQYHRVQQQKISARTLEMPKSILVEDISPEIPEDYIVVYFECKKHGGGLVLDISYIPEDNSAIITFQESKVVATILQRKHSLMNGPVSVYPYYKSLGTAMYGKERLQIKMPDPFPVSIDPYHWRFLQQNYCFLQEITREMAGHCCEIKWPSEVCGNLEIMVHPSLDLSKRKRSLVKTWKEDALTVITQILSRHKVVRREINSELWEAIRNSLVKDDILIMTDASKREVVLVGAVGSVKEAEEEMKVLIENVVKKMERERLTIEETILITACKYAILCNCGLQKNICLAYPELKITYDASKELITLYGLPAEVFKIKSDILERMSSMVQKPVDIHSNIFVFLQHVDNESLSRLLFWTKMINAYYELSDKSVLLFGGMLQDLDRAEEELKKDLTFESIELEDCTVTKKKEWLELTEQLYKAYNCSGETILIEEQEDKIVIAGYFKEVATAYQKLSDFVDNHTYIQRNIKTKSAAVVMYIQQEKSPKWNHLNGQGVKIHFGILRSRKVISLEGPRVAVLKGVRIFNNILSSLHAISIAIDKPGAKSFFKEREELYINGARQWFNCLIRIQEDTEEVEETGEEGNSYGEKQQSCYKVKLGNGILVVLQKADLTQCSADVVVNASNGELMHIGGLASRLLEAAGPELQKECKDQVRQHGSLNPGCATITNAWNLPCKQVIHAVGPRWQSAEKEICIKLLKKSVRESLKLADRYQHRSIAIPAISSGIFGFPLKECTHSIVTAIKESLEDFSENSCLKQIYLMDIRDDTIQAFSETLNEVFGPSLLQPTHFPKLMLLKKGIEEAATDVIVNSVARDLQLDKGPLSKALLAKAGGELQVELTQEGQGKDIKEGCVLKTSGYDLSCRHVLHAVLPAWNQKRNQKASIIEECLKVTEQLSLSSITFPAIGTGNLGYPKQYVAKLFFDEVFKFSQAENPKSLKEVHFVLHSSDDKNYAATDVGRQEYRINGFVCLNLLFYLLTAFFEPSSTLKNGILKMQIGSVELQLEEGDITKQKTDAIVNITNQTFNLRNGASKAILQGAGPQVVKECDDLASQPHNNLICTQGGNLPCKNIIHLVHSDDIKNQVSQTLMECEERQFTSVVFPAIGTGIAKRDPVRAADSMIDAVVDYASTTSAPRVREIKIIIFQPHLLDIFYASMQRKGVMARKSGGGMCTPKSLISKVAEFFTIKKPAVELKPALFFKRTVEPAVFQICGDHQKNVESAAAWIKSLILESQNEYIISDEWISNFGESEYKNLEGLQKKLHVAIKLDSEASLPSLCICGITKDVLHAKDREEKSKADLLTNLVLWRYEDNGQYRSFDSLTNMQIEAAAQHQRLHEDVNAVFTLGLISVLQNQNWKVAICKGLQNCFLFICKDNLITTIPEEWDAMEETMRVKVVELKPEMVEYKKVQDIFNLTCKGYTIQKIERIQNPYQMKAYQIKKQEMDAKNGSINNERLLFHGTDSTSVTHINSTGFNRSYAGLHAACYGNGTYFAVNACYSANDTYSKPDASGIKYMYLARVLVGEYCVGSKGLVVPHQKSGTDPTDLYDSVTDHLKKPNLFVIFNDIQAYPEYLITFYL